MRNELHNMSVIQAYTMNSSKSSRNFILRVLLFLLMVVAGENVMGQEVIYPGGNSCVEPGQTVTIYFPKKNGVSFSDYFYGTNSQNRLFGWSVENRFTPEKIDDEHFRIRIPQSFAKGKYSVYYGRTAIWWVFFTCYYGSSSFDINVCQDDPYMEIDKKCICPGDEIELTVLQSEKITHIWKYRVDDENTWKTISSYTPIDDHTISFITPNNIKSRIYFKVDDEAEADVSVCLPILYGPQCAAKNTNITFKIEQACPSVEYKFDGTVYKSSNSYTISKKFTAKKDYKLEVSGNTIAEWTVSLCNVSVECPNDFTSFPIEFTSNRPDCSVIANDIIAKCPKPTQTGGNRLDLVYWYKENGSSQENKVDANTVFQSGNTYDMKIEMYVDDKYMGVCDIPEFRVVPAMYTAKIGNFVDNKTDGPSYITSADGSINYGKSASVPCGTKLLYHAIPGDCQKFKNWRFYENNWWNGVLNEPDVYEVIVDRDIEYLAAFQNSNLTIKAVSEDDAKGTVAISSSWGWYGTAQCNQPISISATPKGCSIFLRWNDGVTDNPRNFNATKDVDITAFFESSNVSVSATTNDPVLGTAAIKDGLTSVSCNSSVEVTATPTDECSEFVQWEDGSTTNPRTVTVNGDKVFTATFRKKKVTATASSSGHGSASVNEANPECGSSVEFTATPDACYSFSQWEDGSTENPRTVSVGNTNVSHSATFAMVPYQISASASGDGSVSVTQNSADVNGQNVSCGSEVTLTATPNGSCVKFDGWSDGNKDNPRKVTVDATKSFTATFSKLSDFSLTCSSEYSILSSDGSVSIPLPIVDVVPEWSVDNGLTVSGSNIVGTLPFGTTTVNVTAEFCGNSKSCTTTVKLLKSVPPCEK